MLTQNLPLHDANGDTTTFNLQKYLPDGSTRIDIATTPTEPSLLLIKHTASGKDASTVDRHLMSCTKTLKDAAGIARTAVVNLTITVPRSTVISQAMVIDLLARIIDLASNTGFDAGGFPGTLTNVQAILRGES